MKPLFCRNFDDNTQFQDLAILFSRYGRVHRINMRSDKGYAFVYFDDENHASDAIQGLHGKPFGNDGLRLSVEWGWHVDDKASGQRPSKTLFVVHFDRWHTRECDLERHFRPYGRVLKVSIHHNYAFVEFETQEGATEAWKHTHMSMLLGKLIMVNYAFDERRGRYDSSRRDYGRRGYDSSRRSPSPGYRQSRMSLDYVRRKRPVNDRYKDNDPSALRGGDDERRGRYDSPRRDYGRPYGSSRRSPSPGYRQSGLSPDNVRHQWPVNDRYKGNDPSALQGGDDERRGRYDSPRRDDGRPSEYGSSRRSPSPGYRQIRLSPDNMRQQQRPVNDRYKDSGPSYARDMSPYHGREQSQSPVLG